MSNDPHADPATEKPKYEKVSVIRCGDCLRKIAAPPKMLADAYRQHALVCGSMR